MESWTKLHNMKEPRPWIVKKAQAYYLLRYLEANEGAQFEHFLHLFRGGGDERDALGVLSLLQLPQTFDKCTLSRVDQT